MSSDELEAKVCEIFIQIEIEIENIEIRPRLRFKKVTQLLSTFWIREILQSLRSKEELKKLVPTTLDFPETTKIFISKSMCPKYKDL